MTAEETSRNALDGETITIRRGLAIYKVNASPYYRVRIRDPRNGKYIVRSTKETSRIEARKAAEEMASALFASGATDAVPRQYTFEYFADLILKDAIQQVAVGMKPKSHQSDLSRQLKTKSRGLLNFFGRMDVRTIQTKDFTRFMRGIIEKEGAISSSSQNQLRVAFRKVMKTALEEGAIDAIPPIPKLSSPPPQPRPFFRFYPLTSKDHDDYDKLLTMSKTLEEQGVKVRGIQITSELRDIILFTVHSFVRPTESELYALKHSDVTIAIDPKRLLLTIRKGKTGYRQVDTMPAAVSVYDRCQKRYPDAKREDYIFLPQYKNRDTAKRIVQRQFKHLLEYSGIEKDKYTDQAHSMYSLRHTALCMRLVLSQGDVNPYWLAKNAGTSVEMLQKFYLSTLPNTPQMARNIQSFGKRNDAAVT
jgi:hypothetical protein